MPGSFHLKSTDDLIIKAWAMLTPHKIKHMRWIHLHIHIGRRFELEIRQQFSLFKWLQISQNTLTSNESRNGTIIFKIRLLANLFSKKSPKICIPGGKRKFVLKMYSHLIIFEISKMFFIFLKYFFWPPDFFHSFFRFHGSRSLHFRGLFFIRSKLDFLRIFEGIACS